MSSLHPPRGMHDLLGPDGQKHLFIIETARRLAARCGFETLETPLIEPKEVFKRTLGTTSDVVSKEMYELISRGDEDLVLRPEGTAGAARAVLSNGLTQSLPLKFFYAGPMFRYERPQKGRLRQFHHIGVELFGPASPVADVELIALAYDVLKAFHLDHRVCLEINTLGDDESRSQYRTHLVNYLKSHESDLSADSKDRLTRNPLRILDSKDEGDKNILKNAPRLEDSLNAPSQEIFQRILEGLTHLNIPFKVNPHIVRGLDYYCHVAFEFTTMDLGAQGTVLAGGRYDTLTQNMGGPLIPGVGWAAGVERLAMMLSPDDLPPALLPLAVISANAAFNFNALALAEELRQAGWTTQMTYDGNIGKGMKKANKMKASYALILGEDEVSRQSVTCKNLDTGEQTLVPREKLLPFLEEHLGPQKGAA